MNKIGTMFHGSNKLVGNIWIVYQDNSNHVALLYDGRSKGYCPDFFSTKKDTIKIGSTITQVSQTDIVAMQFLNGPMPQWAQGLCNGQSQGSVTIHKPIPAATLPYSVIQKVQKALDIDLTDNVGTVILRKDDDKCPINGYHKFVPYTGLVHSFEFCSHCDQKREMKRADA